MSNSDEIIWAAYSQKAAERFGEVVLYTDIDFGGTLRATCVGSYQFIADEYMWPDKVFVGRTKTGCFVGHDTVPRKRQ